MRFYSTLQHTCGMRPEVSHHHNTTGKLTFCIDPGPKEAMRTAARQEPRSVVNRMEALIRDNRGRNRIRTREQHALPLETTRKPSRRGQQQHNHGHQEIRPLLLPLGLLRRAARRYGCQPVQGLRPVHAVHQVHLRQIRRLATTSPRPSSSQRARASRT